MDRDSQIMMKVVKFYHKIKNPNNSKNKINKNRKKINLLLFYKILMKKRKIKLNKTTNKKLSLF
jgi:hypothetical protein